MAEFVLRDENQPPHNPSGGFVVLVTPAQCERRAWQSRLAHNSPTAPALQSWRLKRPLPHPLHLPSPHKHRVSEPFIFFLLELHQIQGEGQTTSDVCSFLPDDIKHIFVSLSTAIAASHSVLQNSPIEGKKPKKQSQHVWCKSRRRRWSNVSLVIMRASGR